MNDTAKKVKYGIIGAVATAFCIVGAYFIYCKISTSELKQGTKESLRAPSDKKSSVPSLSKNNSLKSRIALDDNFSPKDLLELVELLDVPVEYGASFTAAHMEFVKAVCSIAQSDNRIGNADLVLEEKYSKAKALFTSHAYLKKNWLEYIYSCGTRKEAFRALFSYNRIIGQFLDCRPYERILTDSEMYMVRFYKCFRWQYRLWPATNEDFMYNLTFVDYAKERKDFINALYGLLRIYFDTFLRTLVKEKRGKPIAEQRLEEILEWWMTFEFSTNDLSRRTFYEHTGNNIKSVSDLLKFTYEPDFNRVLKDHFQSHIDNLVLYNDVQGVFCLPPIDELLEKYYTPIKTLPVNEAVLNTPPRKIVFQSTCFASCYFQIMANFLPLMKRLPGWSLKTTQDTPAHQRVFEQLSVKGDPLSIKEFIQLPVLEDFRSNPLTMVADFINGFEPEGLPMSQLLGFVTDRYFPVIRYLEVSPGFPETQNVMMIGQLLVTWIYDAEGRFDPVDLPLQLSLNLLSCAEKKRYELYGFGMKQKMSTPHIMAFVKRATGVWYECDCLKGKADAISEDQVPYTAARQALISKTLKQRPEMAVYLRTEE